MKRVVMLCLAFCFAATLAFAQAQSEEITLKGTIIDNLCADSHKDDLATFVNTHPKSCALMPDCVASGYSIYSEGKLMKFDKDSNAKIAEFLKEDGSNTEVAVVAKKSGEELSLVSISNQEKPVE